MFKINKTFSHPMGFHLTPIEMEGIGLIFLPKELEKQLGYEDISNTIRHSESFAEGIEYIILTDSNLQLFKELLNCGNTITAVTPSSVLKHSRSLTVLTESGLRNLLALSRKPQIQGFREWVSIEVLPEIKSIDMQMLERFKVTGTFTNDLGFNVTPIEMQGVGFIFLPQEVEEQLGYEDLAKLLSKSESFSENIEYRILRDDNLNCLKELLRSSTTSGQPYEYESIKYSPSLIVLTEQGLYTVAILSRKPAALVFRRWVTGDILPSLRQTGRCKVSGNFPVRVDEAEFMPEIVKKMDSLEQTIEKFAGFLPEVMKRIESLEQVFAQKYANQNFFQQYALESFQRIEAVLVETLPHDMFEGYEKIKKLVDRRLPTAYLATANYPSSLQPHRTCPYQRG